jgi:hypothetical protein
MGGIPCMPMGGRIPMAPVQRETVGKLAYHDAHMLRGVLFGGAEQV